MKIPEYASKVAMPTAGPAPVVSSETAAAPWTALSKVGEEMFTLSKVIQERQDEVFRVNELSERQLEAEKQIGDLTLEIEKERDPKTAAERFTEGMVDIRNRVMEGVEDYKVANALTTHLTNQEAQGTVRVKHAAYKWTLENDQEEMMSSNDRWKKAAVKNPDQVGFASQMIRERVAASVATGSILPETGRALADKEVKDLYVQVMGQMLLDSPETAPERIKPLLAEAGLDPNDSWAMEQRAEHARAGFETNKAKSDKVRWESEAARMIPQVRAGVWGEKEIYEAYAIGRIGPEQQDHLLAVRDASKTRVDADNMKTSYRAMSDTLVDVYVKNVTPEIAARRINSNTSILPEHKAQAMQTLLSFAKGAEGAPPQMEKAIKILMTQTAPSFLSMNPRAEEKEAAGEVLREAWTDYFQNEKKYRLDPDLLIKRAIERTSPQNTAATVPASPYKDKAELLKAYNFHVLGNRAGFKAGKVPANNSPRHYWQRWFDQMGEVMPPWPGGK